MDAPTKQLFIAVVGIVTVVSSVAWAIAWHNTTIACTAMENGYTSEVLPGSNEVQWVKKQHHAEAEE